MNQKRTFLQNEFIPLVSVIDPDQHGRWGKMNAQQMVEHVGDFFRISTGKLKFPLVTPIEQLPKYYAFLMSEKEFRENTKAPILPDEPAHLQNPTMRAAISQLETEVSDFFDFFSNDHERKSMHPVFGELNFEEWIQLHHKHVKHHLKQFGKEI